MSDQETSQQIAATMPESPGMAYQAVKTPDIKWKDGVEAALRLLTMHWQEIEQKIAVLSEDVKLVRAEQRRLEQELTRERALRENREILGGRNA
jgi:hypothetical protein